MPRKKLTNGKSGDNLRGSDSRDRCRNPPGRTPIYNEETCEKILDLLWSGECKSLKAVSEVPGMPTRRWIHARKDSDPEFCAEIEKAQMALGDLYLDDIHKITNEVRVGKLDPSAGNVTIKSNQWLAQITDPRRYANKSYSEKTENKNITVQYVDRIPIEGLDEEQLDAIEDALFKMKMLPSPDGTSTPQ